MNILPRLLAPTLVVCLLLPPGPVLAHGDTESPLYVAEGGVDAGDCLAANAPCATLGYALSRAGKGGQVLVAAGTYPVARAEDVFHLVSGAVDVSGGYEFTARQGAVERGVSILTGVPFQFRDLLEARGFEIVADKKGIDPIRAAEADKLLDLHNSLKSSISAAPCTGGTAAGLPCNAVDLLSHVGFQDLTPRPSAGNDIWGFVDLNTGREYAIAGFSLGTAVFDVTDATNPREVGFIDGQSATWRDIKVYQFHDDATDRWRAYAYVTTDGSTDGLFVIDLSGLPHSIRRVSYPSDITRAHNVYAVNTDYATGISLTGDTPTLIIAGSNLGGGRFRTYALTNPESPTFISGGTGIGYMHDASSIIITDARKDTQCINAGSYCEVLLDFNENMVEIWDVTDPASPVQLSATPYPNAGYVHSGWWSEDKQTLYVHDELDERDRFLPTTLRAFSMADLRNPLLAGSWTGPTNAIDHNGFVRGNRYYMSNYTRGLTILDISNPVNPVAVGRLDTYPASDGTMFNGAWGAYPFFWSGNIAINDIDSGFYMAEDRTRGVANGMLQFASRAYAAGEGQQAQLVVQRSGGSAGAATVGYEILHATADANDYAVSTGTLSWSSGDSSDRNINLAATNDGVGEPVERLIVRLINPTGGATLGNRSTTNVYLSDPGAAAQIEFLQSSVNVAERGFATIVVVARRSGSALGAVSADISVGGDATPGADYLGAPPATLSWADGDGEPKSFEFSIVDDGAVEGNETLSVTLANPTGATVGAISSFTATIMDADGANLAPNAIAGASQTVASGNRVNLNGNQSSDPDGDILGYQWNQIGGPGVALNNANSSIATFTAPTVSSDVMLQFRLTVTDPAGLSDVATTTVTVTKPGSIAGGSGGGATGLLTLLLLGAVALRRRLLSRKDAS